MRSSTARAVTPTNSVSYWLARGTSFTTEARPLTVDKAECFCEATGEDGSLHADDAVAQSVGFDAAIAPGMLVQSIAVNLIDRRGRELLKDTPVLPVLRRNGFKFVKDVKFGESVHVECLVRGLRKVGSKYIVRLAAQIRNRAEEEVQRGQVTLLVIPLD